MVRTEGVSAAIVGRGLGIVCLSVALLGSACAEDADPVSGSIEVWGWNVAAASLKELVDPFNDRYPDIDVDIVMSGANMQSRLLLSLVARAGAPDVCQLQCYDAPKFNPSGRMMDLTALASPYKDSFSQSSWSNCIDNGNIYAIPWDAGPCAVYYKRDLFNRYDIDIDAIETWDDYIEAGKHIVEASNGETRMLAMSISGLFDHFEILIQQTGGGVFAEDGSIMLNSPSNVRALEILRAVLDSGIAAPIQVFKHEFFASFNNDTIASYPYAVWLGGSIKDYAPDTSGNWGVFRLPAPDPGGLRTSNLGGSVLAIPDQGTEKAAAWAFVEYALCTSEGQLAQYRNFDLFPSLMTTYDDPFFDEPDPFYGGQSVRRLFATDIEQLPTLLRTNDWNEAKRYIEQGLSRWASDGEDHEAFLAGTARKLSRKLGRPIAQGKAE